MDSTNGSASPCTETTIEFKKERSETGICRIGTLLLYLCTKHHIFFTSGQPATFTCQKQLTAAGVSHSSSSAYACTLSKSRLPP